eukprot:TRINITY_DN11022_c0_g1_i1.p1 TRINITY_DN11022_c0_g1~~TRINITY_DN11022_c0_g1_i1.p1  ORF type:complete len:309 (+),score=73.64 TRINITY_DN11022_c0_g1_i1:76-1002(+)
MGQGQGSIAGENVGPPPPGQPAAPAAPARKQPQAPSPAASSGAAPARPPPSSGSQPRQSGVRPPPNAVVTGRTAEGITTIIRWTGPPAEHVQVVGSFSGWDVKHEMVRTESVWACSVTLPPGSHHYAFLVDGVRKVDANQTVTQQSGPQGSDANTIAVQSRSILREDSGEDAPDRAQAERGAAAVPSVYDRTRHRFEETRKAPPMLPPHLRYTPLNAAPQLGSRMQEATATQQSLPQPLHVTINHTYFQAREGYNVIGLTHRQGKKWSTMVYYRAQAPDPSAAQIGSAMSGVSAPGEDELDGIVHMDP